ncbi:MAG: hypothetical protein AAF739_17840 [Pseudomonadota bacterium]
MTQIFLQSPVLGVDALWDDLPIFDQLALESRIPQPWEPLESDARPDGRYRLDRSDADELLQVDSSALESVASPGAQAEGADPVEPGRPPMLFDWLSTGHGHAARSVPDSSGFGGDALVGTVFADVLDASYAHLRHLPNFTGDVYGFEGDDTIVRDQTGGFFDGGLYPRVVAHLHGDEGIDTVDYSLAAYQVTVDLAHQENQGIAYQAGGDA